MKKILLSTFVAAAFAVGTNAYAILTASDSGANYGSGWTNGANGGSNFQPWVLANNNNGTTLFAGNFIGDPTSAGIGGMATNSFGLYANPATTFSTAERLFASPLSPGATFSLQWGVNWDSGATGNKGFVIFSGTNEWVNVNNGGSATITFNGTDTGFGFGTNVMNWSFAYNGSTFAVSANDRDGTGSFATNIAVGIAPAGFRFYTSGLQSGDQAQPYFNNLNVVPEPSTYALLTLGALALGGYAARRRARK